MALKSIVVPELNYGGENTSRGESGRGFRQVMDEASVTVGFGSVVRVC